VAKQILIYPMLDDRNVEPIPGIEEHALCKADDSKTGWQALLGDRAGSSEVSEYAAPARARSVVGLPATYIMCGQLDIFIEESTKFALKLVQAQVPVEYHIYPGVPHAFESMAPHISYARAEAAAVAHAVAAV
jgi:acetyl esterase/lipase